jgi:hypothetical protein
VAELGDGGGIKPGINFKACSPLLQGRRCWRRWSCSWGLLGRCYDTGMHARFQVCVHAHWSKRSAGRESICPNSNASISRFHGHESWRFRILSQQGVGNNVCCSRQTRWTDGWAGVGARSRAGQACERVNVYASREEYRQTGRAGRACPWIRYLMHPCPVITETIRIQLALFLMQNRPFTPYLAAIESLFQ